MAHSEKDFITWGKLIGGNGGSEFYCHDQFQGVKKIEIWENRHMLLGFRLTFRNSSETWSYGTTNGGQYNWFEFEDREYIVAATLGYSGYGNGRCGFIAFNTNHGRKWGCGNPNDILTPFSFCGTLLGMYGRCGSEIDSLGFIFCKPIKSLSLSDIKYDFSNIDTIPTNNLVVGKQRITNNGPLPTQQSINISKSYNHTTTYSHGTSLTFGFKYTAKGGMILQENSIELSVAAQFTQTWGISDSETITVSVNQTVPVPSNTTLEAVCEVTEVSPITLPYVATATIQYEDGTTETWTDFTGVFNASRYFNVRSRVDTVQDSKIAS